MVGQSQFLEETPENRPPLDGDISDAGDLVSQARRELQDQEQEGVNPELTKEQQAEKQGQIHLNDGLTEIPPESNRKRGEPINPDNTYLNLFIAIGLMYLIK